MSTSTAPTMQALVLAAPNGPLMAPTPLTLAETASVFGEMLTFRAILAATPSEGGDTTTTDPTTPTE